MQKPNKRKVTVVFETNNLPDSLRLQSALNSYVASARKFNSDEEHKALLAAIRQADANIVEVGTK